MVIFFFKQKTAYEMRISDWSSDVCSSDLKERDSDQRQRYSQYIANDMGRRPGARFYWGTMFRLVHETTSDSRTKRARHGQVPFARRPAHTPRRSPYAAVMFFGNRPATGAL